MKTLLLLCSLMAMNAFANSELEAKLQGYIKTFKLTPMSEPAAVNRPLFRLGKDLFFETKLSGNNNISCADCHHPMMMSHDGLPLGLGEGAVGLETKSGGRRQARGKILARNSMALFNLHSVPVMFWDGRVQLDPSSGKFTTPVSLPATYVSVLDSALAAQALFPMVNHEEMRGQKGSNEVADAKTEQEAWQVLFKRIISVPEYKKQLEAVFPGEDLNLAHVARAIGHFEAQAFYAGDTPFDDYLKGKKEALTEVQKIGMDVFFGKGKCGECHQGEHLSDFSFHNVGVPQIGPGKERGDDLGRAEVVSGAENLYAFRVPPLRNVSQTAPYMHNGAFKTLAQVIEHYDDVAGSLSDYVLVNNYKNYMDRLEGPLKSTDDLKLANLSKKLTPALKFLESEEKALAEFIRGALTDKRFINAEIAADYVTSLRIQLNQAGFEKILAGLPANAKKSAATYYYYDVLTPEGYGLRELERPVKIYFTQTQGKTQLTYRKQLFKSSSSVKGLIAGATFEDEETLILPAQNAAELAELNKDFYARLYAYHNGEVSSPIPDMELSVMKSDVELMNRLWHGLGFNKMVAMSDELNFPVDEIFFAPTSMNTKEEYAWNESFNGHGVRALLQHSRIRTETGGLVDTWAVELSLEKIQKRELANVLNLWLTQLVSLGLVPEDGQGSSPSPSKLTERVLKGIFPGN